jgi:hypothetical protein
MRVRFLEPAQYDLDDAYLWYEKQMPGLGREFLDENIDYLVEWREGISPSRSPRTGRDSLPSSSSYCPALT